MNPRHTLPNTLAATLLAAAACGAQAQSSVTVFGLLDMSLARTQAPGAAAVTGIESGKLTTNHIGFRGSEDLGNGLKAQFTLEGFMRNDTGVTGRFDGDVFWARNAYVGLDGGFGSVALGRVTTSLFVQTLVFNPFGDSFGYSPAIRHWFASGTLTGDSAWSDSVRWASPRIGGFSATLHSALGESNGGNNSGATLQYASGGFTLGLAWQRAKKGATVADTDAWQVAAMHDLGVVKLFGQAGRVDNDTSGNRFNIVNVGLTAPVGASGLVRAQWGRVDPRTGAERKTLTLGYSHFLSKRTELYGAAMNDKLEGTGTGNSYGVGVRHRF